MGLGPFRRHLYGKAPYVREIDLSVTGWKEVRSHTVLTFTGIVKMVHYWYITQNLTAGGSPVTIGFGNKYNDQFDYMGPTSGVAAVGQFVTENQIFAIESNWLDAEAHMAKVYAAGDKIGYTPNDNALTGGKVKIIAFWEPVLPGSAIVAGDGSAY